MYAEIKMWRYFISDPGGSGNAPSAEVNDGNHTANLNIPYRAVYLLWLEGRGGRMRRNEITPELIELSKRAKELGFPQDVEEGDWVKPYEYIVLFNPMSMCIEGEIIRYANGLICDNWFLILSFSRCLEWLRERDLDLGSSFHQYHEHLPQLGGGIDDQYFITVKKMKKTNDQGFFKTAKTHHEAIAKAVVKILEGEG